MATNQEIINLLETLPPEVQKDVKEILRDYEKVNVVYMNGKYTASPSYFLMNNYPEDFKVIGEFKASEIFTPGERNNMFFEDNGYQRYPLFK